ncbi:MAG: hypothetical protein COW30_13795 [Rhodospirillales bacterium CG15_BIG_FIL_POST_REV_8_21_14_020_66_15]|nr:MAG: hypothetical protein COW30_13795 [Rhodospirillales bacterium CG15_BIG_FIL_POST_REV_8_21_14_020_66_15]
MTGAATTTSEPAAPPTSVVIHDLDQARRVLASAARAERPVRLVSAPGAGAYLGPALFNEIVERARAAEPAARTTACLDCGEEPGTAMAALRHGIDAVTLSAAPDILAKVADAAQQAGARVVPPPANALDMAEAGAERRLDDWLRGDTDHD